jgi:transmembrane sensor
MTPDSRDASSTAAMPGKGPQRLKAEAAVWTVRLDSGRVSRDDSRLLRWLARSDAHRQAFDAASAAWRDAGAQVTKTVPLREENTRAEPSSFDAEASTPPRERGNRNPARWRPRAWLSGLRVPVIASVGVAALAVVIVSVVRQPDWSTATGEQRTIALDDGSTVKLDAQSAIDVKYTAGERRIILREGRAAFHVAHDEARPFVVVARDGTTRDIGTVFQVDRLDEARDTQAPVVGVVVTAGRVEVVTAGGRAVLGVGEAAQYRGSAAPAPMREADVAALTAWQKGRLRFDNVPLRDVLQSLNRYYPQRYLYVRGPAAMLRVSGNFNLNDPAAALNTLCDAFGLDRLTVADRLVILSRK